MSESNTKVYNLIKEMQRQLIELEEDVFCRGKSYRHHSLPRAEQLLKYSKELIVSLRDLIKSDEVLDEV